MKVNSYQRLAEHDLYAMVTVARDVQRKMLIEVNPDMHKGNAYLKLYNAASKQKASEVARISMYEPIYIEHANVGRKAGKKDWILNSKEKREFIAFLNSVQNGYTVWQKTIIDINKELDLFEEDTMENLLPNPKYPDYLPYNLPIPDYMKL
jgi:hypothetical protein